MLNNWKSLFIVKYISLTFFSGTAIILFRCIFFAKFLASLEYNFLKMTQFKKNSIF